MGAHLLWEADPIQACMAPAFLRPKAMFRVLQKTNMAHLEMNNVLAMLICQKCVRASSAKMNEALFHQRAEESVMPRTLD